MKKILIGITGCIAAYKTIDLIRQLNKNGYETKVIITASGLKFVTELTVKTISKHSPYTDQYQIYNDNIEHIELAKWADIVIIAPATANTIAKIATGIADNLLSSTILAMPQKTKLYIAPAMNTRMWDNPITQKNLKKIGKFYKHSTIIQPKKGLLACNETGVGAMADIETIYKTIVKANNSK
ncbi:MAG: hypothetical protein A2Y40_06070 [Candidatus Margulisbacteria bacterium GWF2_35_9]|nr:MAG: hypothetical protein A2Y40_06070 [Candidatus Margulisbacteria bacterium GWF2_35_9]